MRKIKFRAWDKYNRVMLDWHCFKEEICDAIPIDAGDEWTEQCIVMQYTGLRDKNGKEIYEGDILSWVPIDHVKFNNPYQPFCVYWDEAEARYTDWSPREDVIVIGNIYEDSHLLAD